MYLKELLAAVAALEPTSDCLNLVDTDKRVRLTSKPKRLSMLQDAGTVQGFHPPHQARTVGRCIHEVNAGAVECDGIE